MEKITLYIGGLAKGNPGPAAIGVSMVDASGQVLKELSESIGNANNDYAEYFAVVRALQVAEEKFGAKTREKEFEIKLSNELVKKQLNNEEPIKNVSLIGHFIEIHNLGVASFPNVKLTHISPAQNQSVEKLISGILAA